MDLRHNSFIAGENGSTSGICRGVCGLGQGFQEASEESPFSDTPCASVPSSIKWYHTLSSQWYYEKIMRKSI